jgi:hypothetical protein
VELSQFNGGGFATVGLQFERDYLGHGLSVSGYDNENSDVATTSAVGETPASSPPDLFPFRFPTLGNSGEVYNTQYDDGGFGNLQRDTNGNIVAREGRVGLQWRNTRIRGPVNIGLDDVIIPSGTTSASALDPDVVTADAESADQPTTSQKVLSLITNAGLIRGSQFNDGGFGDIGMQWFGVSVGGRVATSTNTLFIKPTQTSDAITVENQVFGASTPATGGSGSSTLTNDAVLASSDPRAAESTAVPTVPTTYANSATNSGRIVGAQFNDGGFGDVGLQWRKVTVGGSVTAVHNSLTVQPQNKGQGLITVQNIQFPSVPASQPNPPRQRLTVVPATPAVIKHDGSIGKLPKVTGPLRPGFKVPLTGPGTTTLQYGGSPFNRVNAATNSGLIKGGQFNAGGFGDEGLQWQKVHVAGNVELVHNSLSVHPQGAGLAGINVSNVSYGPPVSKSVAQHLSVLPYARLLPNTMMVEPKIYHVPPKRGLPPPNDRWLVNQQVIARKGIDIFLQWNGIEHKRGLVIVHNVILIKGVGPQTGPITLSNIRFPFKVPKIRPVITVAGGQPADVSTSNSAPNATTSANDAASNATAGAQPAAATADNSARASRAKAAKRKLTFLNAANNSGIISHAQFSDGGFGDIGLQWRNVSVKGSVDVVHNTLAVDESNDDFAGDRPGPINVSNVTFNSGALNGDLSLQRSQRIVSPPNFHQRKSTHEINTGTPLPESSAVKNEATNSGILAGGQLSAGGSKHIMLQLQCVKIGGRVTVEDNVLSISVLDRPSDPINISNVTFA